MSGITTYTVEPTTHGAVWYILSHSHYIAAVALLAGLLLAPLWNDTRDRAERTTMTIGLMAVTVLLTASLLLVSTATVLGRVPSRVLNFAGIAVSGICLLSATVLGDPLSITIQTGAFTAWCGSLALRRYALQLRETD